ncbi:hypothetical protein RCO48_00540 [Peribacillus frigoritolerans]|nr:hypothetical protein [Peribacillus frigoritolerans]
MSTLLMKRSLLDENAFWEGVARTILTHQKKNSLCYRIVSIRSISLRQN